MRPVVLLDDAGLEPVEVAQEPIPFGLEARSGGAVLKFLGEGEGEEGAEDLTGDGDVAGVEDGTGVHHRLQGRYTSIGTRRCNDVETGLVVRTVPEV